MVSQKNSLNLKNPRCIKIANALGVKIINTSIDDDRFAYYMQESDTVFIDVSKCIQSYLTPDMILLHELAHATGHETRLKRFVFNSKGEFDLDNEEIIAQYSAHLLGLSLNILTINDKDYTVNYISQYSRNMFINKKQMKDINKVIDYISKVG